MKKKLFSFFIATLAAFLCQSNSAMNNTASSSQPTGFEPGTVIACSLQELMQKGFIKNNNPLLEQKEIPLNVLVSRDVPQITKQAHEVPAIRVPDESLVVIEDPEKEGTFILTRVLGRSLKKYWHLTVTRETPVQPKQKPATIDIPSAEVYVHISDLTFKK